MAKEIIGAQGEITIIRIDALPENVKTRAAERTAKGWIISHSESGNHHILTGGDVMEREGTREGTREGMRILYAALAEPHKLVQDAAVPHGSYDLPAGLYEFRIAREFDPFSQQARQVAD